MALIEKLVKKDPGTCNVHQQIYGRYKCFSKHGIKYFQIDTYGLSTREKPGKISQSIQLNKQSAKQLWTLLGKEFNF